MAEVTSAELRDSDGDMEQPVAWDSGPNVETVSAVKELLESMETRRFVSSDVARGRSWGMFE